MFLNPCNMSCARLPLIIEEKDSEKILPSAMSPSLSRQHGTTVPSTNIAAWYLTQVY